MVVTVTSRHMEVTPALKEYAEQKAGKLLKYYDKIQEIEVTLDAVKKDGIQVDIMIVAEHRDTFIARSGPGDAYAGIDQCVLKLERQLTDHKKKFRNRKHDVGEDKRGALPPAAGKP